LRVKSGAVWPIVRVMIDGESNERLDRVEATTDDESNALARTPD
jgi:hypothetical protein